MKLTIHNNQKSLKDSEPIYLPDFVVITGENGSGKSQLLSSINQEIVSLRNYHPMDLLATKLTDNENQPFKDCELITDLNNKVLNDRPIQKYEITNYWTTVISLNTQIASELLNNLNQTLKERLDESPNPTGIILKAVLNGSGKHPNQLTINDVITHSIYTSDHIFSTSLSFIFFHYYLKMRFLGDVQQALKDLNAPWHFFNNILEAAEFKFRVTFPDLNDDLHEFEARLFDIRTDKQIRLEDLSTGEKTIMALFFVSYNSSNVNTFPDVLLLDEPDAPLHPSMSKIFLDVVQNIIVKQMGIKVIMTTHSPSTIALTSPESIYLMSDGTIMQVDKNIAIKSLTLGLKNLSISFERKRQVFVEGDFDEIFYSKLFSLFSTSYLKDSEMMFFISSGKSDGGCSKVISLTKKLTGSGIKNVSGIIDWDLNNKEEDKVKVLGFNRRYAIENYLFDPVILSLFFLYEQVTHKYESNFDADDNIVKAANFDADKLQSLVDAIINFIEPTFNKSLVVNKNLIKIILIGGYYIDIPEWYLLLNGHNLEKHWVDKFPYLQKYSGTDTLKNEILNKIMIMFPDFLPSDLIEIFKQVSSIPFD